MRPVLCPVLVGRDGEMRHLRGALDAASTGRGRTVLLVGEAGIGMSRLARELSAAARQQGLVVLTGRAVAGQVPVPFRPFAEALSSALRVGGMAEPSELGPLGPPLARLVPEWRHLRRLSGGYQPEDDSPVLLGESVLWLLRVPNALAQRPTAVLGNQAGPARLSGIAAAAGFTRIREAARTPFNIVLEARP